MQRRSIKDGAAKHQSAQALVEFALVLPVMLVLVLGSLDIGRAFVFGVAVQDGARQAARLGAATAGAPAVTDRVVLQRLIAASAPALDTLTCHPNTALTQPWHDSAVSSTCGNWTFTINVLTQGGTCSTLNHLCSIADAIANDPNCHPKVLQACQLPSSQLTVTARGDVSMWAGFTTSWGWSLFPITAQGQAAMVVL